jgi:nucleoid DNA-binding protein
MAKENIAFMVNLRKNTQEGSPMEGRYYPEAESKETLSTKGFAKHVSEHGGTLVTLEFMQLVLAAIVKCLKEMMSHGQPVKLDGLGTFRPTVTSVKNGAATIEDALRMGVNNMVAGVNFVFIPENAQGEEITSKKFKDQCSLQFAYLVETVKKVIGGKEKSYTLRTPLSAWGIISADEEGSEGSEGSENDQNGGSENGSSQNGGTQNGGDNSGSQGQQGDQNQQSGYALTIATSGSGSATVTHDGNAVTSGSTLNEDDEVEISITPAEGQVPTASINSSAIELTEDNGVYTGSFAMPGQASALVISTGVSGEGGDGGEGLDKD